MTAPRLAFFCLQSAIGAAVLLLPGSVDGQNAKPTIDKSISAAFRETPPAPVPLAVDPNSLPAVFQQRTPRGPEDLQALEKHVAGLADRLHPTTVAIETNNATGSGVVISSDGLILTAGHVFERPGRRIVVRFTDGTEAMGISLGHNERIDSGLCKITSPAPEGGWPHAPVGELTNSQPGDFVLAIGHPGGFKFEEDRPYVVRLGRLIAQRPTVLQTDATVVGGDSGGPLFDMHGRVIGIHSRINSSLNGNFHIPITTYLDTWERLYDDEHWGQSLPQRLLDQVPRPQLGIEGRNNPDGSGAIIDDITPESAAAQAGLRVGDLITGYDGTPIQTFAQLRLLVVRSKPGQTVELTIQRRGEERLVRVTLGSG